MEWTDTLHTLIGDEGGDITWWQMSLRATIIFLYGLALVRLAHKRVFGKWAPVDIVLSVVIGSNLSRTLTGNSPFVETLVATTLLVVLHSALTDAAARMPGLGPLLKGRPAKLIEDGRVDEKKLRKHAIGEHDLQEALRACGLKDASEVDSAYLERNGDISVVKR